MQAHQNVRASGSSRRNWHFSCWNLTLHRSPLLWNTPVAKLSLNSTILSIGQGHCLFGSICLASDDARERCMKDEKQLPGPKCPRPTASDDQWRPVTTSDDQWRPVHSCIAALPTLLQDAARWRDKSPSCRVSLSRAMTITWILRHLEAKLSKLLQLDAGSFLQDKRHKGIRWNQHLKEVYVQNA